MRIKWRCVLFLNLVSWTVITNKWESMMCRVHTWKISLWLPTSEKLGTNASGLYANWFKGTLTQVLNTYNSICTGQSYIDAHSTGPRSWRSPYHTGKSYLHIYIFSNISFDPEHKYSTYISLSIQNHSEYHKDPRNILKKKKSQIFCNFRRSKFS